MLGDKCEVCGDEVLILKALAGKRLCLDCYCKYKDDKTFNSNELINNDKENQNLEDQNVHQNRFNGDRRCPNCGRIIPFDSIICPYCGKKFETFF